MEYFFSSFVSEMTYQFPLLLSVKCFSRASHKNLLPHE
jgi:hypothetical protein